MKEIEDLSNEELLTRYKQQVEYVHDEKSIGQVTPHEREWLDALEQEVFNRMS